MADATCSFEQWIASKARMFSCRQPAYLGTSSSSDFCSVHLPAGVVCPVKGERVVCPFSSSHILWKSRLEKHVLSCDAKGKTLQEKKKRQKGEEDKDEDEEEHSQKRMRANEVSQADIQRVNEALASYNLPSLPVDSTLHPSFASLFPNCPTEEKHLHKKSHNRHSLQQSSLLMHMQTHNLLSPDVAIEFGCGTAKLSLHLQQVLKGKCSHLLVDRQAFKKHSRKDDLLRSGLAEGEWLKRLQIDIKELHLNDIPELREKQCLCMSKHLCGPATDLALRTVVEYAQEANGGVSVAFATCCHCLCEWSTYVNQKFFADRGFGADEFPLICSLSAWATLDSATVEDGPPSALCHKDDSLAPLQDSLALEDTPSCTRETGGMPTLRREDKLSIGQCCKQLLDEGRAQFLTKNHFRASLARYTSLSKENIVILAQKSQGR